MTSKAALAPVARPALADCVEEDGEVRIFIEHNDNFRLPANPANPGYHDWPWNRDCAVPRLYAAARGGRRKGRTGCSSAIRIRKISIRWNGRATSRGRAEPNRPGLVPRSTTKIYVQDKLREQGAEVWRWINDGAHIYVCGDANRMAKDVEQALLEGIAEYGAMDASGGRIFK